MDRRIYKRQKVTFSCAELGGMNAGILLNLSEGGLALQAITALTDSELPAIRFQIAHICAWLETKGRIVWKSDSDKVAGVEFINLSDVARKKIQAWIDSRNEVPSETMTSSEGIRQLSDPMRDQDQAVAICVPDTSSAGFLRQKQIRYPISEFLPLPAVTHDEGIPSPNLEFESVRTAADRAAQKASSKASILFLLAASLSSCMFFFLGYHVRELSDRRRSQNIAWRLQPPNALVSNPLILPSREFSSEPPGLVLQVGAMAAEESASLLAKGLLKREFPAFVYRNGKDHIYLVFIGPYHDLEATLRAREELKAIPVFPLDDGALPTR